MEWEYEIRRLREVKKISCPLLKGSKLAAKVEEKKRIDGISF